MVAGEDDGWAVVGDRETMVVMEEVSVVGSGGFGGRRWSRSARNLPKGDIVEVAPAAAPRRGGRTRSGRARAPTYSCMPVGVSNAVEQ